MTTALQTVRLLAATIMTGLVAWRTPARAEMSVDEKMMEAAAIVLAASSQNGGTVVVQSGDAAFLRSPFDEDVGRKTTFRKVDTCIYAQTTTASPGMKNEFHVIDFSKLTGGWGERGDLIEFYSRGSSHCSSTIDGCWQGHLHIASFPDHRQMIDDVNYMLRHGCDASVNRNDDPDPH